ncbi:AcrR family transcriptional regulator [Nocardia sp. GAS34]|uniref:TetR/AcrR family transcriptional regulator n=1 Tax=unclassified Nocardia TaxID=2637762 RepID=UPI003D19C452
MGTDVPTRRQLRRAETTAEIKDTALRLMAANGPGAITLRAIAREMGMTANAVYSYFPTRDDLVTALIRDVYDDLADALQAARDSRPSDDPTGRTMAWAKAFRSWSLANTEGFRLIYGDPIPGYRPPEGGPAPEAEQRVCAILTGLAAAAPAPDPSTDEFAWGDFDPGLVTEVRALFPDLSPAMLAMALRMWGRLHGLVSLEILGHMRTLTTEPDKLYHSEVEEMIRGLGL